LFQRIWRRKKIFIKFIQLFLKKIDEEERLDEPSNSQRAAPEFGDAKSPYEKVKEFYNFWRNFVSQRKYSWHDEYNPNEGEGRQEKRFIEKHNKKKRDAAKKARNEEVRHLVETIRKKDKRVLEFQIAQKLEEEKQKNIEDQKNKQDVESRKKMKKQMQQERDAMLDEIDWSQIDMEEYEKQK